MSTNNHLRLKKHKNACSGGWILSGGFGESGGCAPRIAVIVTMQKKVAGGGGLESGGEGVRSGGIGVAGLADPDVNQELKVLLKEHKGIV